jgi:hypothetical protein
MIVTVTATVMDGTAVRWYRGMSAAEMHRPVLSASRRGVKVYDGVYLNEVPPEWIAAAMQAYETLRGDPRADVKHLATHVNKGPSNGPLVPVEEVADHA